MEYKAGTMLEIDGIDCCVLDCQKIDDKLYLYVAEIVDDDITENFYLYKKKKEGEFEKITNSETLKEILPIIIQSMSENIE